MRARSLWLVTLAALAACGPAEPRPTVAPQAIVAPQVVATPSAASTTCAGNVDAPQDGLREIDDPMLLKTALGDPGKGALCLGKVFEAVKPVIVFRVWSRAKSDTQLGRWWSFARPQGPVEAYRAANEICPEWSALDVVSECHLKVGARIVVGPGQSAACQGATYPASATNQVFVPNDTRDPSKPQLFVEGCTAGAAWP